MSTSTIEIQIAASAIRGSIPKDKTLKERVQHAMRYVQDPKHERDILWMTAAPDEDFKMRTALAAVMLEGDDADRDVITRSLQPLRMLAAAASGIPVDFSQFTADESLLPLMKMWQESKPNKEPPHDQ